MLIVLGKRLKENGWSSAIAEVCIATSGRAEAITHKKDMLCTVVSWNERLHGIILNFCIAGPLFLS